MTCSTSAMNGKYEFSDPFRCEGVALEFYVFTVCLRRVGGAWSNPKKAVDDDKISCKHMRAELLQCSLALPHAGRTIHFESSNVVTVEGVIFHSDCRGQTRSSSISQRK